MKKCLFPLRIETCLRRNQLENRKGIEGPTVSCSYRSKFFFALGKRDVKTLFSLLRPFQQVLEGKRGLACPGSSFNQVKSIRIETPAEDVVETGYSGGNFFSANVVAAITHDLRQGEGMLC